MNTYINVYFGAQIRDTLNFGVDYMYINHGPELIVTKYTNDGVLDWEKIIDSENGYNSWLGNVTVYDTASLFVGGRFNTDISFDGMKKNQPTFMDLLHYWVKVPLELMRCINVKNLMLPFILTHQKVYLISVFLNK